MKNIILPIIIVLVVFFGIYFLEKEEQEEREVSIAVSFYPLFDLASHIGGERVDVINLTPPGVDPHEFEPSLKDMAKLEGVDIFLYNGGGLDPWAEKKEEELKEKGVIVLKMSSFFNLHENDGHYHEEEDDDHYHQEDPHFWLDPLMMKEMAEIVFENLVKIDKEGEEYYKKNRDSLFLLFEELDEDYKGGLDDCFLDSVVISHASLHYLAERYGFEMIAISGISPIEEPSAKKMAEIASMIEEKEIKHIFFETTIPSTLSKTIAEETGAKTLVFNPVASLTKKEIEEGKNYFSVMKENLEQLKIALDCK
jgi:zinc transport system substrate-binding protein